MLPVLSFFSEFKVGDVMYFPTANLMSVEKSRAGFLCKKASMVSISSSLKRTVLTIFFLIILLFPIAAMYYIVFIDSRTGHCSRETLYGSLA